MERSRYIQHKGREIYMLDCSDCKPQDISDIIDECARQVRSRPEGSVRTLTIAGGGKFDNNVLQKLKELTQGNAPYVDRAAVVGITGLYKVVMNTVKLFSKRQFHLFDTVEEAKDFLASE
ncbi:MAG: hypothetical protein C0623_03495 [Desulfuromonas sp.]|nr:MAG: hypothetical protein C0623_03495 [Desulfuromonas sp.]